MVVRIGSPSHSRPAEKNIQRQGRPALVVAAANKQQQAAASNLTAISSPDHREEHPPGGVLVVPQFLQDENGAAGSSSSSCSAVFSCRSTPDDEHEVERDRQHFYSGGSPSKSSASLMLSASSKKKILVLIPPRSQVVNGTNLNQNGSSSCGYGGYATPGDGPEHLEDEELDSRQMLKHGARSCDLVVVASSCMEYILSEFCSGLCLAGERGQEISMKNLHSAAHGGESASTSPDDDGDMNPYSLEFASPPTSFDRNMLEELCEYDAIFLSKALVARMQQALADDINIPDGVGGTGATGTTGATSCGSSKNPTFPFEELIHHFVAENGGVLFCEGSLPTAEPLSGRKTAASGSDARGGGGGRGGRSSSAADGGLNPVPQDQQFFFFGDAEQEASEDHQNPKDESKEVSSEESVSEESHTFLEEVDNEQAAAANVPEPIVKALCAEFFDGVEPSHGALQFGYGDAGKFGHWNENVFPQLSLWARGAGLVGVIEQERGNSRGAEKRASWTSSTPLGQVSTSSIAGLSTSVWMEVLTTVAEASKKRDHAAAQEKKISGLKMSFFFRWIEG
mmetsp:Transcript_24835/g.62479  ORF Transcript_24835/g.62479 Transcript_24835/m.62479 type:complete len:567 (-) Transcript_24835:546-2246(-)